MATKSTAVKKSKTVTKTAKAPAKSAAANKNVKKVAPKAAAKKPVAKKVVALPVKKAAATKAKTATTKTSAKAAPLQKVKNDVKKATALKATTAPKKATAKNMPEKNTPKAKAAAAVKAPAAKATATKAPAKAAKNNMSVEEAVARVMRVVGNEKTETAVKATATAGTAKVVKADKALKPAKNDNMFDYKAGDMVVYPAHGVGQVEGVETLTISGLEVTLYTITFLKDRMRLKLPLQKVKTSGLRPLSTKDQMNAAMQTMRGRARIKRVMWSRRAQEYEAKINSGSPVQVAEVLRDLRRNALGAENSYSERQIFQAALERLASELAAIEKINETDAAQKLQNVLTEAA